MSFPAAAGVVCFSLETATCPCASRGLQLFTCPQYLWCIVATTLLLPTLHNSVFLCTDFIAQRDFFFKAAQHVPRHVASGVPSYLQAELSGFFAQLQCCRWSNFISHAPNRPSYQLQSTDIKHNSTLYFLRDVCTSANLHFDINKITRR